MVEKHRIRDYGVIVGDTPAGALNAITDVPGVRVGHVTLSQGDVQTGVTVVLPHSGNIFQEKVIAASHVINGFGKTVGIIQIDELGAIETPIMLTNTLSVGVVSDGLVRYMLAQNPAIGVTTGTVNPVVCECNDGFLNDIRGMHIRCEHVQEAIDSASVEVVEGAVGAGTGMSCFGLKGGIGTASRRITLPNNEFVLGVLVLTNFGRTKDFVLQGRPVGGKLAQLGIADENHPGSVIVVFATNLPATERQLRRVARRGVAGLARTGSCIEHGSGDIVLGFTTANRINHQEQQAVVQMRVINEDMLDSVFVAMIEATEEAVLNSLVCARSAVGRAGHRRESLRDLMEDILGEMAHGSGESCRR